MNTNTVTNVKHNNYNNVVSFINFCDDLSSQKDQEDNYNYKKEYKVKPPIIDKEYLILPVYSKTREGSVAIPKKYIPLIKEYFHQPSRYYANNLRNYAYFVLEINIGRRAGDALNLKIRDIVNEDGTIKDHIIFSHEQKTKKKAIVFLNINAKEALAEYLNTKDSYCMSEYLFQNYKTGDKLSVDGMRKVLKRMTQDLKLDINITTHSLRKTFATEAVNRNPNNEMLVSMALNHSDIKTTRFYTKRTLEQMDQFYQENML